MQLPGKVQSKVKSNKSRANLIKAERKDHHPVNGGIDEVFASQELYLANEHL